MHLAVARTSCSTPDLSLPIRSSPAIIPGTRRCLTNLDLSPAWRLTGLEGDLPSLCKAEKFEVPRVRKSSPKQDLTVGTDPREGERTIVPDGCGDDPRTSVVALKSVEI